jgi:hypothetical protein
MRTLGARDATQQNAALVEQSAAAAEGLHNDKENAYMRPALRTAPHCECHDEHVPYPRAVEASDTDDLNLELSHRAALSRSMDLCTGALNHMFPPSLRDGQRTAAIAQLRRADAFAAHLVTLVRWLRRASTRPRFDRHQR